MQGIILKIRDSIFFGLFLFLFLIGNSDAFDFPAAAWHRGDTSFAQENSRAALVRALQSDSPNIEADIIDFIDQNGNRVGLVSHDYKMSILINMFRGTTFLRIFRFFKEQLNHYNNLQRQPCKQL
jgi:hypothetical protein